MKMSPKKNENSTQFPHQDEGDEEELPLEEELNAELEEEEEEEAESKDLTEPL